MSSVYSAASSDPPAKRKRQLQTTEPLTAHERHSRMWAIRESYARGARPPTPQSKHELDILKERHQFVRSSDVDPSTLSWEDQLAAKYYDSLFKEFAIVNLKHYKSGAIALRWRTEDELLAGIGHLTCASLRCRFHAPSPARLSEVEASEGGGGGVVDPDSTAPLVETRLEETEMNFGYVEGGERKSALVKVVLCRECAKRLRYGRERAREMREGKAVVPTTGGGDRDEEDATGRRRASREGERRRGSRRDGEHSRDRSRRDEGRRREDEDDDDDFAPVLPPDLEDRRRSDPRASSSRSRRRSTSPPSRRSHR
ncbi:hypothetical protein JCM5296_003306 [Sporobolomyces johnsonii]